MQDFEAISPEQTPEDKAAIAAYQALAKFLEPEQYPLSELALVTGASVVAVFASEYHFDFSVEYIQNFVLKLGLLSKQAATDFGYFCGTIGLVVNTAINTRSTCGTFYVCKDKIFKKRNGELLTVEEKASRRSIIIQALIALISALPNSKFVYDTNKDKGLVKLIVMEIIQVITMSALNFRGLYNLTKTDENRKKWAEAYKFQMLKALNLCLVGMKLSDSDIKLLSQGILVRRNYPLFRNMAKYIAYAYDIGYATAFFASARSAIPHVESVNFWGDILNFLGTTCAMTGGFLRWFLLISAVGNLTDTLFDLISDPILVDNSVEIRLKKISRNAERLLIGVSLALAFFSLGGASRIVGKYLFEEETIQTAWQSLLIGGGAAWGINSLDLSVVIYESMMFIKYLLNKYLYKSNELSTAVGVSHNQMIFRLMCVIGTMPDDDFLEKFVEETVKIPPENSLAALPDTEVVEIYSKQSFGHNCEPNSYYDSFMTTCQALRSVPNSAFSFFKNALSPSQPTREQQEELDRRELVTMGELNHLISAT